MLEQVFWISLPFSIFAFWLLHVIFNAIIKFKGYGYFYNRVYMNTPHWKFVKWIKYGLWGRKCQVCGTHRNLSLHHVTYAHKWWEFVFLWDLQVLCWAHHKKAQEKMDRRPKLITRRGKAYFG